MRFSEKWLREWVDPPLSTQQLAEQLTMAGFEVDALDKVEPGFTDVLVARVEHTRPHPGKDNLTICTVNDGSVATTEIVCGADNVATGKYYALAKPDSKLPGDRVIKAVDIYGVQSAGMLCSAAELGLGDTADSLLEITDVDGPGASLSEHLGLNDTIFELSLTPNRGDCLSIAGIAREVAVINRMAVTPPAIRAIEAGNNAARKITLKAAHGCPRYVGRVITGIDISRPSPTWLTEKLRRSDIRSINIIVDISNYVMLELGQPMHAFDNDKLAGAIAVRFARKGESIILLDELTYNLADDILLITDADNPVAMAGIMGGAATAVGDTTRNIFLESAYFSPASISGRARHLGLHTDASHRFERGVDYQLQRPAIDRATQLILEYCGGEPGPVTEAVSRKNLPQQQKITLEYKQVRRLLGIDIETDTMIEILTRLGMAIKPAKNKLQAVAPSYRFDLSITEDLVEELARIHGYHNFPGELPGSRLTMRHAANNIHINEYRWTLINRGYNEAITYSFVDRRLQSRMEGRDDAIPLLNPISSDMDVMRQSLWPGLLLALQYNLKRQQHSVRLFEYGLVFNRHNGSIRQIPVLGGLIYGKNNEKQWDNKITLCDFYDIKGDVEALMKLNNQSTQVFYQPFVHHALHPGQAANIILDDHIVGAIGAVHPALLQELDILQPVYVFELEYERISAKTAVKFTKISKFPSIKRDISIVISQDVPAAQVMASIKRTASELLHNLELFDVYQGEGIDLGKKSLALGLTFQRTSSTLTDEEAESILGQILETLYSEFGATLRE